MRTPEKSLVLICRRCRGNRVLDPGSLRDATKRMRKSLGLKEEVRVVFTDCLGACPKHAVTAVVVPKLGRPVEALAEEAADDEAARLLALVHTCASLSP